MRRRYLPRKRLGMTFLLSFSLLATGMILFAMLSPLVETTVIALLRVLAGALIVAAFAFLWRFGAVSYAYYLVDNRFCVNRIVMKRQRTVCDLDVRLIRAIVPEDNTARPAPSAERIPVIRCHNYTTSVLSDCVVRVYYGTDDDRLQVLLLNYHRGFFDDLSAVVDAFSTQTA